jgi:FlaA1/EpsC-like NDP-sugar epimerase
MRRLKYLLKKWNLENMDYMPRWFILYIDLFLVVFAIQINEIVLHYLGVNCNGHFSEITKLIVKTGAFALAFTFFKTFSGLIRHSTFHDAIRLLYAVCSATIGLLIIDYAQFYISEAKIFMNGALIFNALWIFTFLLLFRIGVKTIFESLYKNGSRKNIPNTIVFGNSVNSISLVQALKKEKPLRFNIVAFVDKDASTSKNRIFNLPIIPFSRGLETIFSKTAAQAIIIADNRWTKAEKLLIVESSFKKNAKVYNGMMVASVDDENAEPKNAIRSFKIEDLLQRQSIYLDNKNVVNSVQDKVVLVTGGAGSIGSEIVMQLASYAPKHIIVLDQAETPLHEIELELSKIISKAIFSTVVADITDETEMEHVFAKYKPEYVFHAAAYKHVPMMEKNREQAVFANVLGVRIVSQLAVKYEAEKFVFISTDKAVNPTNIMGSTKRIAEHFVQSLYRANKATSKTKFITTRFGNVLGSNGSVVRLFKNQIEAGGPVTLTHPEVTRYFMTIPEACQLVLEAGAMGRGGEIYIFDMGEPIKILDLAYKMIQLSGKKPVDEIEIKFVGLRPGEKLYEELLTKTSENLPTHHQKIMVAQDVNPTYEEMIAYTDTLIYAARNHDEETIIETIKQIVPEYYEPYHSL